MKSTYALPASAVTGLQWPALPHAAAQTMLATQFQLERSQYWPAELIAERQLGQLRSLVAFSLQQVPHYRHLIAQQLPELMRDPYALTREQFARWPLLSKGQIRDSGAALVAASLPQDHGGSVWQFSSGTTGAPVRSACSMVGQFFRSAAAMRNLYWHEFDFSRVYAEIRPSIGAGRHPGWGAAPNVAYETGPMVALPVTTAIDTQLDWLLAEAPGYLHSTASNIRELILRGRQTGRRVTGLDAVISFAETLPDGLRELVREEWGARLIDVYSSTEAGLMALQCPRHEHYHVQSEFVVLEVLRENGSACTPGETGRVVVTDLTNFAMPIIRFDIGDYAEAGSPCDCGRHLPVISRIRGRARNMAVDPTGRRFWPNVPERAWWEIAPMRQVQMVQHAPHHIELRYVLERELTGDEKARYTEAMREKWSYPYDFTYSRVERIEHTPGQKREEFIRLCD